MFYFEILEALYKNNIRYLIVGGLAVNLHNVPRMTNDIDFILAMDEDNLASFTKLMKELGYIPKMPVNPDLLTDKKNIETWIAEKNMIAFGYYHECENYRVVDIVISHPIDFEEAYTRKVTRKIQGIEIYTVSLEDLIVMKHHSGREMDLHDITLLKKAKELLEN
jgi:hypothetical protein